MEPPLSSSCANCGATLDADAVFCSRCGLNLTKEFRATPIGAVAAEQVSDTFRRLRESLGNRYGIERELGRGGMATVFLARDLKHDREVAIKVLHPDLAATIGAERFEREIKLAAKLQHPHILGLYDSGDADGLFYYVMPFVKGESLRDRLDREKMLPIDDAIRITLEVASALGHAHEQGIVHRDIKPENILLAGEHALVADFGIARAATEAGQQKLTQTGMAVGTPVYMAPEQSSGDAIGPTADIYSLGCMLYEMLAGEPPFNGPNAMAIMARHLMEQPPSVRVVRSTVPEEVEEAIFIALNKAPVDRPQTAQQFAQLLSGTFGQTSTMRVMRATRATQAYTVPTPATLPAAPRPLWRHPALVALGAVAIAVAGTALWLPRNTVTPAARASANPNARRVAVLPFVDHSRSASLGEVADGLTDGLIRTLATSTGISVVSRGGVEPYRGSTLELDSIARALRVGYFVRGEVEADGNRVRVTVRLDDASGVRLSSGRFAIARDSIRMLQDSLGRVAADLIRVELGADLRVQEQRVATRSTDAWLLLQRGVQTQRRAETARAGNEPDQGERLFDRADSLFAAATTFDPLWADPWSARAALAYRRSRLVGRDPARIRPWVEQGLALADSALSRDPDHADALETRGTLRYFGYLQNLENETARKEAWRTAAQSDLERATQLNRNQAGAYATLTSLYATLPGKTIADVYLAAQRAYEADEFLANATVILGRLFFAAYDLENATAADDYCRRLRSRFPGDARAVRCQLYLMTMPSGTAPDVAVAWRLADSALRLVPPADTALARRTNEILVAAVIARASHQEPSLADSVRRLVARSQGDGAMDQPRELAMYGAMALTLLGDHDEAMRLLRIYVAANPQRRDALRTDPGWWYRPLASRADYRNLMGAP